MSINYNKLKKKINKISLNKIKKIPRNKKK